MSSENPIGVLDSGLGGLSVLRALVRQLPDEDFLYCSDNGNAPWGDKETSFILERTRVMIAFLIEHGAKAVVIACNTATAVAADTLRREFTLPIIGIEPAGLMECVERGEFDTPETKALLEKYLRPMLDAGIDTLVLACTHYPFLENAIRDIAGRPLTIIEPSKAVAATLAMRLKEHNLAASKKSAQPVRFWIKDAKRFTPALKILWPNASRIEELTV